MKTRKILTLLLSLSLATSCNADEDNTTGLLQNIFWLTLLSNAVPQVNLREAGVLRSAASGKLTDSVARNSGVRGLHMGELEVVGYDYRPGEAIQSHWHVGGFRSRDWSYWVVLQNGYERGRNNVLRTGERLNINSFMQVPFYWDPQFAATVGAFEVDLLEVSLYRVGVIYESADGTQEYFGAVVNHPDGQLHKYPEWRNIPMRSTTPVLPGLAAVGADNAGAFSILFVRSDWFDKPCFVRMQTTPNPDRTITAEIKQSTYPLNEFQSMLLRSLVEQGTTRRRFDHLLLIPYVGPERIILSRIPPEEGPGTYGGDQSVDIDMDLTRVLNEDPAKTDLKQAIPKLTFHQDAQGIPFGLSVQFSRNSP